MIRPNPLRVQAPNDYPTSDGKPMAETDVHRALMNALIETLKWWFADEPTTYVSGNLLVHYEEGNRRKHVAPDVFVVPGVGGHTRQNYLLWEEGRGLDLVIELTSRTTSLEDIETKYNLYVEKMGVKEYVLFDPMEEYLAPSFQAHRRHGDRLRPVKLTAGRFRSRVIGLDLERDGTQLRLRDPATGDRLPTPAERAARAEAEADQLRRELEELRRLRGGA